LQKLTTRNPTERMLQVAIMALKAVLKSEGLLEEENEADAFGRPNETSNNEPEQVA
jgi:uncharacterized protein YqhQ